MTRALLTTGLRKPILMLLLIVPVVSVIVAGRATFATAGACTAPATDYGTVTNTVNVPATGTYRIWTRMSVPNTTASTFMLEIDGSNCYTIGGSTIPTYVSGATTFFASGTSNWTSKTSAGTQVDVSLAAGAHTFKLIGNAAGVVVDRLVLTQDTVCVPTGTGDNCANPPDITAPVVSITSPASGANISASTTVTANATDDVAVSKVEFYVDGVLKATDTTGSSNNYTYSFNPASFSIGSYTLTAKAYDAANNSATSSNVTVTVMDVTAPTVSVTAPASGATVSGSVNLAATATDNVAVSKVEFYVDGTLKGTDTTGSSNAYSLSLDTTSLSNASHFITAKAYDAANNSATSSAVSVTVNNPVTPPPDTTPPTVSVTAPASGATVSGSVNVTATAADASGIASVAFYVDGVLKNTDTVAPYSFSLDTTTLSNGTHPFKAVATDNSSSHNTATSTIITATVSNVTYLAEDINQNGHVDLPDFSILASNFGKTRAASSNPRADINGNGIVDLPDFSLLASKFGT